MPHEKSSFSLLLSRMCNTLTMSKKSGWEQKSWRPLQKMFTEVSAKYDLMNRLLTLRFDEQWRKLAARECISGDPSKIVDLCTGTGDLALHISGLVNGKVKVTGLDYSEPMLELARDKARKVSAERICFIKGDAANMPFEDHSINVIGIAFGFRNLMFKNPDKDRFLKEIFRVLSKNGKLVIVETSQPPVRIHRWLFHNYLKIIVPGLGGIITGHKNAYKYLAFSACHFFSPDQISSILAESGFSKVNYQPLLGGVAGITTAYK